MEIQRIHRAIANEICGHEATLTMDELEFLCDLTATSLSDVASALKVHRSAVSATPEWRMDQEDEDF